MRKIKWLVMCLAAAALLATPSPAREKGGEGKEGGGDEGPAAAEGGSPRGSPGTGSRTGIDVDALLILSLPRG